MENLGSDLIQRQTEGINQILRFHLIGVKNDVSVHDKVDMMIYVDGAVDYAGVVDVAEQKY